MRIGEEDHVPYAAATHFVKRVVDQKASHTPTLVQRRRHQKLKLALPFKAFGNHVCLELTVGFVDEIIKLHGLQTERRATQARFHDGGSLTKSARILKPLLLRSILIEHRPQIGGNVTVFANHAQPIAGQSRARNVQVGNIPFFLLGAFELPAPQFVKKLGNAFKVLILPSGNHCAQTFTPGIT